MVFSIGLFKNKYMAAKPTPKAGDKIIGSVAYGKTPTQETISSVTPTSVPSAQKTNFSVVTPTKTLATDEDYLVLSHVLCNGQQFFVMGK